MGDLAHALVNSQQAAKLIARCNFPLDPTPAAVSGGADSMALMLLAHKHRCLSEVIHVDHGLRPESHRDVVVINEVASQLGIKVTSVRVDVGHGPNLEARARQARYSVLPEKVMTGHTQDDQAETVIINLLRGSGTAGLSAMNSDTNRPLLELRRFETELLCEELGISYVNDETNSDPTYQRNRIRAEVIPLLNDVSHRDIVPVLARQAEILRADDAFLGSLSSQIDPTNARALAQADPVLAKRALRAWLADPYPPDSATVDRAMAVARGEILGTDLGGGRHLSRHQQVLKISRTESANHDD